ncbi:MAG: hypothetical protein ISR77_08685 [Pirellulaceae bacterium]|nr:hypothetical protein [Pirellulaceae bacterium]
MEKLRLCLLLMAGCCCLGVAAARRAPAADLPAVEALQAAVEDLQATFGVRYPGVHQYLARLGQLRREAEGASGRQVEQLQAELDVLKREALIANPLVSGQPILFVVRRQYELDHSTTATIFKSGENNEALFRGGGAIKKIDFARGGRVTTLLGLPEGVARDLAVDFDGRRFLFAMRRNQADDYHIYRMNADGSGLVQLTFTGDVCDIEPMHLPDGRIVFSSTRDPKYCGCNRHIMVNLFVMEADGANIRQIGRNTLAEERASMMPDGRILYNRWEYVDTYPTPSFDLWTTAPDGTSHTLFYGNDSWAPGSICDARIIPGTRQVIAVFAAQQDRPWGALVVLDHLRGVDGTDPIVRSWPADISHLLPNRHNYGDGQGIGNPMGFQAETFKKGLPIKYEDPYPLSEKYFLCARMTGDGEQMGIFLLDTFGNEILLHTEEPGCFDPVPLVSRARPPTIPPRVDLTKEAGYFYLADVYRGTGMARVPRGTIKTIRVIEALAKRFWATEAWRVDSLQAPAMNFNCTSNKRILGDVPVEPDGSTYFEVPADKFLFFQALDADGMMVQSMRSGTSVQPGETVGCVGCHENRLSAISVKPATVPLALHKPPSKLKPWNGPPRKFSFLAEVQPVFDKHCVECHDYGKEAGRELNLAGDMGLAFNTAYLELHLKSARRWFPDPPDGKKLLVKAVDDGPPEVLLPYAWGSHRSRLVDVIRAEHYELKLDPESFDRIVTWIDLNAPYYGTYANAYPENLFGRSPLDKQQLARLAELTGVPLDKELRGAELGGSQVSFTRPELSPCLAKFSETSAPAYQEALAIIRAGTEKLALKPRADTPGFKLTSLPDIGRQARREALAEIESEMRQAILDGRKRYEQQSGTLSDNPAP